MAVVVSPSSSFSLSLAASDSFIALALSTQPSLKNTFALSSIISATNTIALMSHWWRTHHRAALGGLMRAGATRSTKRNWDCGEQSECAERTEFR